MPEPEPAVDDRDDARPVDAPDGAGRDDAQDGASPAGAQEDASLVDDHGGARSTGDRGDARRSADAFSLIAALLLAAAGLCVLPAGLFTEAYHSDSWEVATAAAPASVVATLILTAAAVARASRTFLLVMSGVVVLHGTGLLALALAASAEPVTSAAFLSPLAQLACAVVGIAVAWWDRARPEPRWWPALVPVALGPVAGVLTETAPWAGPWGPMSAAAVANDRLWIVAAVLAAGLVCLPRYRARLVGVLLVVVAGVHAAVLVAQGVPPSPAALDLSPDSATARSLQLAALGSAFIWGIGAAIPPRRRAADGVADDAAMDEAVSDEAVSDEAASDDAAEAETEAETEAEAVPDGDGSGDEPGRSAAAGSADGDRVAGTVVVAGDAVVADEATGGRATTSEATGNEAAEDGAAATPSSGSGTPAAGGAGTALAAAALAVLVLTVGLEAPDLFAHGPGIRPGMAGTVPLIGFLVDASLPAALALAAGAATLGSRRVLVAATGVAAVLVLALVGSRATVGNPFEAFTLLQALPFVALALSLGLAWTAVGRPGGGVVLRRLAVVPLVFAVPPIGVLADPTALQYAGDPTFVEQYFLTGALHGLVPVVAAALIGVAHPGARIAAAVLLGGLAVFAVGLVMYDITGLRFLTTLNLLRVAGFGLASVLTIAAVLSGRRSRRSSDQP